MMPPFPVPAGLVPGGRFPEWNRRRVAFVAADMDGTILRPDGSVSQAVADAVAASLGHGVAVGFATGRMRNGALHIHRRLGAPGPHVFHNGAEVRADGVTIAAWPLSDDAVDALLDAAASVGSYAELYTTEGYRITREDPRAEAHWRMLDQRPDGMVHRRGDLPGDVLKATFVGFDEDESRRIESSLDDLGLQVGAATGHLDWRFINVTMPGVHKGRAVEAAASHLGVDASEVLAIGDGDNDGEMLDLAGTAVAMGQSPEDIRRRAHLVAPSVTDDGVAVTLRALVDTGAPR